MPNNILIKKSSVAARVPTTSDLDYGELALNYADGALYYKTSANAIARLNPPESIGFANVAVTGQSTLVADTATGTLTVAAGTGVTLTTNATTDTLTIAHSDTSSVTNLSSDNSAGVVLQDIAFTFDTYGHVQTATIATTDLDARYLQAESDTLATVTTRGATTTNAITVGGLTVNGDATVTGDISGIDSLTFDVTATEANAVGKLYWDADDGTLSFGLVGGNSILHIGQHLTNYVFNADTTTIAKGEVVYIFSAQGDRASVKKASNATEATSSKTLGVASENIAPGAVGFVVSHGVVDGLSLGAFNPGDTVYLGSTPGTITATLPIAPYHTVFVGVIARANNGNGQLFVKVQNGLQIDELHDIQISNLANNDSLFYDAPTFVWKNTTPANARTKLGLGTIATQNANSVAITGGAIDGTPIGATTASTGKFTTLQTTGNVIVGGNLTVTGTTTTVNAQNLSISDNLILLNNGIQTTITNVSGSGTFITYTTLEAHNYSTNMSVTVTGVDPSQYNITNQTITGVTSNSFTVAGSATGTYISGGTARGITNANPDLGFAAGYNDGTYRHAGFFRDATDGYFKPFKNYTPEPDADIYIDTSHGSFALADIQAANFRGALVGNATTASTLAGTPTINGVTFNGGSNITITSNTTNALTIGAGLTGTSFNGSAAVTITVDNTVARTNDTLYVGTTAIALNRASAAQTLTGINGLTAGATTDLVLTGGSSGISITAGQGSAGTVTITPITASTSALRILRASTANQQWLDLSGGDAGGTYITARSIVGAEKPLLFSITTDTGAVTSNNYYSWSIGGSQLMRLTNTGYLGVGTTNPLAKLALYEDNTNTLLSIDGSGAPFIKFLRAGGTIGYMGTAGAIGFGTNTDLGIRSENNLILTALGNSNICLIPGSTGLAGIGTGSPTAKLDVYGGASATPQTYILARAGSFTTVLGAQDSAGVAQESFVGSLTNNDFKFKTNNTEYMRLTSAGNFGIGTTSPSQKLEVSGGNVSAINNGGNAFVRAVDGAIITKVQAQTVGDTTGAIGTESNHTLKLITNNTARITIDTSGNVGVGTTSPSQKLEVNGNIQLTSGGNIYGDGFSARLHLSNAAGSQLIYGGVSVKALAASVKIIGTSEEVSLQNNNGSIWLAASGNVGIGTTSPSSPLHVAYSSAQTSVDATSQLLLLENAAATDTSGNLAGIRLRQTNGTNSANGFIGLSSTGTSATRANLILASPNTSGNAITRVTINSSGNVGIGTSTPYDKLEVAGGIAATGYTTGSASQAHATIIGVNGGNSYLQAVDWGSEYKPLVVEGKTINLQTGTGSTSSRFYIDNGGNVGIGTTSPSGTYGKLSVAGGIRILDDNNAKLDIGRYSAGAPNSYIKLGANSNALFITNAADSVDLFTIKNDGNVGIGTTSPQYKLHVVGDARLGANGQRLYFYDDGNAHVHSTSTPLWINAEDNSNIYINHQYNGGIILTKAGGGNVGIGEASPSQKLHVTGNARITGALYDSANSAGTNGQVLTSTGTGTAWSSSGAAVTGSGTTGKLTKWSTSTTLADSVITESSGNIGIDTTPTQKLDVNGNIGWGTDHVLAYSTLTTTATTANQVITAVSITSFRTFKFIIQAVDATAGKYQSQEIMAIHNGSTVAHTEYTAISVGGAVATYDVDISGSTVRLLCTPLSANSTVFKVSMQLIKV